MSVDNCIYLSNSHLKKKKKEHSFPSRKSPQVRVCIHHQISLKTPLPSLPLSMSTTPLAFVARNAFLSVSPSQIFFRGAQLIWFLSLSLFSFSSGLYYVEQLGPAFFSFCRPHPWRELSRTK